MRLKVQVFIEPDRSPDAAGELLRELFFDQSKDEYGCYSTFELTSGTCALPPLLDREYGYGDEPVEWQRAQRIVDHVRVEMRYFWDGDGVLRFVFPDGSYLENTDCKKDDEWEFYDAKALR